jgi:hypothetical protein
MLQGMQIFPQYRHLQLENFFLFQLINMFLQYKEGSLILSARNKTGILAGFSLLIMLVGRSSISAKSQTMQMRPSKAKYDLKHWHEKNPSESKHTTQTMVSLLPQLSKKTVPANQNITFSSIGAHIKTELRKEILKWSPNRLVQTCFTLPTLGQSLPTFIFGHKQ